MTKNEIPKVHTKNNMTPAPLLPALDAPGQDPKVEFFLTASHQLKSPVAIIQWCLQSVEEMQTVPPEAQNLIKKALDQTNGMSHLIQDMLSVFRLMNHQTGSQPLDSVSLTLLIDEVISQYELVAHNKGVNLVKGAVENLPMFFARQSLVRQVVVNLVDNAIKYTKSGGSVTVTAAVEKGRIVMRVADQGIGIPDTEQSRIFTEFFRGEEAKDVSYEGTGLGLVLVKHVLATIGGDITFQSAYHKGTTFIVSIPTA